MTPEEITATRLVYREAVREIRREIRETPSHLTLWLRMQRRLLDRYRQILKEVNS